MLDDGETGVIGGLTVDIDTQIKSGVPGLSRVPLLGKLFSYDRNQKQKEELVIIIKTRIIRPGEGNPPLETPGQGQAEPGGN